ncbi:hypothetical protein FLBR109950_12855 [Flavobacterium branchiophilum]
MKGTTADCAVIFTVCPLKLFEAVVAAVPPLNKPKYCEFADGQALLFALFLIVVTAIGVLVLGTSAKFIGAVPAVTSVRKKAKASEKSH